MGAPKRQRKKFSKPSHPWQKERILAEKELLIEYGLNRKYEIWKMNSILKNFTRQAKNLVTTKNPQVEKERNQLLTKLFSLGLLGKDASMEDILSLTLKDILERRLQTLVYRKSLASSIRQARQFIVHEHISLGDKRITAPSYLVPSEEEGDIQFAQGSVISNTGHPIRAVIKDKKKQKMAKEKLEKKDSKTKENAVTQEKDAGKSNDVVSGTNSIGTDKKVEKIVEKTKKFIEGKEETVTGIIEQAGKDEKTGVPSAHDLKKQKENQSAEKKDINNKKEKKSKVKEK